MYDVIEIIKSVLEMEEGEKAEINIENRKECNSLRTRLYRGIKRAVPIHIRDTIFIRMYKQEDKSYTLEIGKTKPLKITLVRKDGTREDISKRHLIRDPALLRVIEIMEKDGRSQEEIDKVRLEWTQ